MKKSKKNAEDFANQVVLVERNLIGVVKYVGPLHDDPDKKIYFGISLGEGKGDCNGTHAGKRYFQCPENKGTFVEVRALKKTISPEMLLKQVVNLNKKLKEKTAKITELEDKLTIAQHVAKEFQSKQEVSSLPNSDDDASIKAFLDGELNKKWYVGLEDVVARYPSRDSQQVEKLYNPLAPKFNQLDEINPHTRIVYTVCASERDNMIASGSDDKTIRLWRRVKNGSSTSSTGARCIANLQLRSCINSLAFSPNGDLLAAALDSGWIELYSLATGKMVGALEGQTTSEVWTICFSPDGSNIISGALDRAVRIWDVRERECRWALRGHDEWVNGVAVSNDGTTIVSGSGDKTVRFWDTKRMQCRSTLRGHQDFVRSVCVTEDSSMVVSASDDCSLMVWNMKSAKLEKTLNGHAKGIYSVAAGKGSIVASASRDASVKIWDVNPKSKKDKELQTYQGHRGDVNSCAFLARGRYVAAGSDDKTVQVFKVEAKATK